MKVYIASSFSLISKIELITDILELNGYEITVKWWTRLDLKKKFAPLSPEEFYSEPECEYTYNRDRKGIQEADAFLFIADDKPRAYNDANIELGMADVLGKPCLSIGCLENSALYYQVIKCKNMDEVLEKLGDIKMTKELMKS